MLARTAYVRNTKALEALDRLASRFPALVQGTTRRRGTKIRQRVLRIVRVEPVKNSTADTRTRWTSRKQQRAFHASDGFGAGVPTVRTHDYINSFEVEPVIVGATTLINLTSDSPTLEYMPGGAQEQGFLVDAGWLNVHEAMDEQRQLAEDEIVNDLLLLADPTSLMEG